MTFDVLVEKACRRCGENKPATKEHWFARNAGRYLDSKCKKCSYEKMAIWRRTHPRPRKPPRERTCYRCQVKFVGCHRRNCPTCIAVLSSRREIRIYLQKSRSLRGCARTRALRYGLPFALGLEEVALLMADTQRCPCCDRAINYQHRGTGFAHESPSIDRVIPSLGYVIGNIAIICMRCNLVKGDASAGELRDVANWLERRAALK